jgi:phage-related baseplate assembly protein
MVVLVDQVAEQEIRQAEPGLQVLVAQVQLDKEILARQQIQEQAADSMAAVAVAPVLPEKQVLSKVTVVTVIYG